jgi:uncharacterized SAM-binding protein YcdF (DUF218 family)
MRGLIVTLAMPPVGFVLLIIIGLVLHRRWRRLGPGMMWVGAVGLLLLGLPIVSHNLREALEADLPTTPPADHPPGAIIVLGGEVVRAQSEPLGVRPGPLTLDRLRTAAALSRRTGLPIMVSGGLTQKDTAAVATVMRDSLRDDFRMPARWVEDRSRDTWENARFSADILRADGITSVYVVTSAWHMRRALLAFEGVGLTVTAAPTPPDDKLAPNLSDFLPRTELWQTGYYALHEWIGYEWYRWR